LIRQPTENANPDDQTMTNTAKPCPICRKPRSEQHRPFCSARCRDRDLARWFGDGYAVPAEPASPEEIAKSQGAKSQWDRADSDEPE